MKKVCVFCGEKPQSKNLEHITPHWLLELTGEPRRIARFGLQRLENGQYLERIFSFNSFQFPACESCNQEFSKLENKTISIVKNILSEYLLSSSDFNTLLDWFDKVRIGLWLGFRYLDKDPFGITPHYYVKKRIGLYDRMLFIFKGEEEIKGLNFAGCDTPSFAFTPSCFLIRINRYFFLNMSFNYLFSRRIGFPYPPELSVLDNGRMLCQMAKGRERIMRPILKKGFYLQGIGIYQPIFAGNFDIDGNLVISKLYDTKYVRDRCISWEKGIGKIFIESDTSLKIFPASPSKEWVPRISYNTEGLIFESQILSLEWQNYLNDLPINFSRLSKEKKASIIKDREYSKLYNNDIINYLLKNAKERGIPRILIEG